MANRRKRKKRKAERVDLNKYIPEMSGEFFSDTEARKEYNRLRKIAKDRIRSLMGSEYATTTYVQTKRTAFKPSSEYTNTQLRYKLYDIARFVNSPYSTVSGQRSARLKSARTLRHIGLNIRDSNIEEFGHFMESVRAKLQDKEYDSDQAARLFVQITRHHIDPEHVLAHYDEWKVNIDALEYQQARGKREGSSAQILERAKKLQRKKFNT